MTRTELKTIRAKLGLTQARLAERLGVTRNAVNQWEMGVRRIQEPTARLLQLLASSGNLRSASQAHRRRTR
jgi:DNA-binding transcriptional regulator YiaG